MPSDESAPIITLPAQALPRAVGIGVLFALAGPPLGGLVAGLSLALVAVVGGSVGVGEALATFLPIAAIFSVDALALCYALGLAPALVCGGVIAWHEGWRGPVPSFSAVLLGIGVGALYYMIGEFAGLGHAVYGAIFSVVACCVPTYLLSRVARFWGRKDPIALPAGQVPA